MCTYNMRVLGRTNTSPYCLILSAIYQNRRDSAQPPQRLRQTLVQPLCKQKSFFNIVYEETTDAVSRQACNKLQPPATDIFKELRVVAKKFVIDDNGIPLTVPIGLATHATITSLPAQNTSNSHSVQNLYWSIKISLPKAIVNLTLTMLSETLKRCKA